MPIRVFIVDDHPVVREGVAMLAASAPDVEVVGRAAAAAEALAGVAATAPDVVLLDLDLGSEDGEALIPELHLRAPRAAVLVLTGLRAAQRLEAAALAGARGLVRKTEDADAILRAIRAVHAGELWFPRGVLDDALQRRQAAAPGRLTTRERELVALVAEGHRNAEIARRLRLSEKTVRNQLSTVYSKLGVSDRMQLMIHAYRLGLARSPA